MKFFRSLLLTVLILLISATFTTMALWLIGHIFHDQGYGSFEYGIMIKIFIASLAFIFMISGLWKDKVAEEYTDSRKFYKINSVVHYGLVLAGTVTLLINEFITGWDQLGYLAIGYMLYIVAVVELVITFTIHSIYVAVKD